MPRSASTTNSSNLSRQDIELLVGLKKGLDVLVEQVQEFRKEYKEQTSQIRETQQEQFEVVIKRVSDIETWKALNLQPERMLRWDQSAKRVDDYLDEKHVKRRETIFKAVETHIDEDGKLEGLVWLTKTRDRWGFFLAVVGVFLSFLSTLLYMLLDNVIIPFLRSKGG